MDINRIFGAFNESGSLPPQLPELTENKDWDEWEENHPAYYVQVFYKLIAHHTNYSKEIISFFQQADAGLDIKEIKLAGEDLVYRRAMEYLFRLDLEDTYHRGVIATEDCMQFRLSLALCIAYFEDIEEYETCSKLLPFKEFVEYLGNQKSLS